MNGRRGISRVNALNSTSDLSVSMARWDVSMTRRDRVRRTFILCNHFLRNLAFYRTGWLRGGIDRRPTLRRRDSQFWVNINSNFIDISVLEWCKLFGDAKGKHHWNKVITRPVEFEQQLHRYLRTTPEEFNEYLKEMRRYRDKFVAHLDDEPIMYLPRLRPAKKSAAFLHDYLLAHENDGDFFPENPPLAWRIYQRWVTAGRDAYAVGDR
jgi:hypothetical protein